MSQDENWISEQKKNADMLKMILSTSKKLLNMPLDAINYQLVVDEIKELSGAWIVGINTYEQSGTKSVTRAISKIPSIIKDITKILGFPIVGKEWDVRPDRVMNLQGGKLIHFNNLYEASKGEMSKSKAKMLETLFNIGDVFVIELSYEKQGSQGDIIFFMKQGDIFQNKDVVEIYAGLIGSFLVRTRTEEKMRIFSKVIDQTTDNVFITDREGVIEYVNPAFESMTGYSAQEAIGKTPSILKSGLYSNKDYELLWNTILAGNVSTGDLTNRKKTGELIYENKIITPIRNGKGEITHFVSTSRNITEKMQHERELESINKVSTALRVAKTVDEMLLIMLDKILEITEATQGSIWLYDANSKKLKIVANRGLSENDENMSPPEKLGVEISKLVFSTGKLFISKDINQDVRLSDKTRKEFVPGMGAVIVPIFAGDNILGTFDVNVKLPREISPSDVRILTALSEIAANAIQRMRLYEKTQKDAIHFASLHSVDLLINSSNNLPDLLNTILDYLLKLLNVDAAAMLLYNSDTSSLEYFAGKGFRGSNIVKSKLNIGEGYAGTAALNQQTVIVNDLRKVELEYARYDLLKDEEFITYLGVPLIDNNEIIGVLDIFHRSILNPDPEWVNFLEALASQAAIAIGKSTLFSNLQRSNIELLQAYDKTIEGWSRAMDLRDHETEGHTLRVTELAVSLAQASGLSEKEVVHIRRGALLHDMGKVGIPDSILLKPGPLTDEEWDIMRVHPQYAFDMLSPIEFLNEALDIPYCHHEKWDGSGYPRGLKGEEIPIAARIFAIVDVWDALRSDRPYRTAWNKEKVIAHIMSLSGTHFEPKIVELFFNLSGI